MELETPFDAHAEHAVIACLFQANELLANCQLTSEHFYLDGPRNIFAAIMALDNDDAPFDFMTVTSQLRELGTLEKTGGDVKGTGFPCKGAAYITEIFTCTYGGVGVFGSVCATLERLRKIRVLRSSTLKAFQASTVQGDPDEIYAELDSSIIKPSNEVKGNATRQAIEDVKERILSRELGARIGTPTEIMPWDNVLSGLIDSRMYVVGARPKIGKTALMETIMQNITREGRNERVLCFQRDMSVADMVARMACRRAGVVFEDFDLGKCSKEELNRISNALKLINPNKIHIYSNELTIQEMRAIERMLLKQGPLSAVFVDVFGKIKTIGENKVEQLAYASNCIRGCCMDFGVPWVVNAHVSREAEKTGRPLPSQFSYCDQLFKDCDLALMMWSEDDPKDLTDEKGNYFRQHVLLSVEGNRGGGVGDIHLYFDRPLMTFYATENKGY